TGKKESTDRHLSQACPPCVTPSSASSGDHCSDARTVEYGSAARGLKKICQSSASLRGLRARRTRISVESRPLNYRLAFHSRFGRMRGAQWQSGERVLSGNARG